MAELLTAISIMAFPKNMSVDLAPYLTHDEFKCKCHSPRCHFTLASQGLMVSYKNLRREWGRKIQINSGFRCMEHNRAVAGSNHSSHTTGHAIDMAPDRVDELFLLEEMARKHFDVVIRYSGFIHCHNEVK